MKISLNWLGLFVDLNGVRSRYDSREIAHRYSLHTAEIEGVEHSKRFDGILVGKVLTAERHPDSSKLWICQVDVGGGERFARSDAHDDSPGSPDGGLAETVQILTGAPNVYPGMFTPVAVVGCRLSPDFVIAERKMAGMISRGMMCGADEIGLSNVNSGGIMDLNPEYDEGYLDAFVGKPFFDLTVPVLGASGETVRIPLLDTVLEIDNKNITNRPDLFGIYGHSREFATVFRADRKPLDVSAVTSIADAPPIRVEILTDRVLSYSLAKVEGIANRESPLGIRMLLERSGLSTHDAIVDMTNYLMMELGQPMHAFDADTIVGHVVVRQAKAGESIVALDGKTYALTPEDIVIADAEKALAIAGIMGGMDTGISPDTKNICIESAVFDPASIRLTAQRLGLRSEASTRFEKSLDPTFSAVALRRAVQFLDFAKVGGKVAGSSEYVDESRVNNLTLAITHSFVESRIGTEISEAEVLKTLSDLEFAPAMCRGNFADSYPSGVSPQREGSLDTDTVYEVIVPSHRATKDIGIVEDIVEEIARIHGYDTISESPIPGEFVMAKRNDWGAFRNLIQNYFADSWFYEAYNYSFGNAEKDASVRITGMDDAILIKNAVSQDFTMMRRSMAPLLFANVHENLKRRPDVKFFEIAKTHRKSGGKMTESKTFAGVVSHGSASGIRMLLDGLFSRLWAMLEVAQGSDLPFLHPNISGTYANGGNTVGSFGALHPEVLQNFELPDTTWYFEVDVAELLGSVSQRSKYVEPNKYPSVSRELNFLLDRTRSTGEVARLISAVDPRIRGISVADIYEHDKIGRDKKSVTFAFSVEDATKTITDEEALALQNAVIESLERESIYLRR